MISVSDCVKCLQAPDGDDVTDTPGQVGEAEDDVQQEAESDRLTETETSTEENENKDRPSAEPAEISEAMKGDLPTDTVSLV